ncbi:CaiB/BaiF CoA transferase family protein [Tomitella cavernea]|uniref:CaiB/BaiF CoA transferase family protein n=1 Tax=Tomitella cavernea TaxID=1387982 RepID=UPI0027DB5470|nr:CoA transferase [Tomitella cavernea]
MTVVEFGQYIAGPLTAMALADLGADVIKVESPAGDAARSAGEFGASIFHATNRGKRSVVVDLKADAGRRAARELIGRADVVVQNMRPGLMERFGLGADELRTADPGLVYLTISGFGDRPGDGRPRAGLDIAAQAESGLMSLNGEADRDPMRVGFAVVDVTTGHLAAQAILAALLGRERSGNGAHITLSLLEVAVHLQCVEWCQYFSTGRVPSRTGNGQASVAPAADLIRTKDGHMVLSAYQGNHWRVLCSVIGREDLADDTRFATIQARVRHRPELLHVLDSAFGHMTTDNAVGLLLDNGLVAGAVRTLDQVVEDPRVRALEMFPQTDPNASDTNGGPGRFARLPYTFQSDAMSAANGAPRLGEHSADVLGPLGY